MFSNTLQQLLDPQQTAEMLGVTVSSLAVWRCTKRYPLPYIKVGRLVKYRPSDVLAFIELRAEKGGDHE